VAVVWFSGGARSTLARRARSPGEYGLYIKMETTMGGDCYANSSPRGELLGAMARKDWKRVMEQAADNGCGAIQFIGGEPTLHPDIADLISHAKALGRGRAHRDRSRRAAPAAARGVVADTPAIPIVLGDATVALSGPWKFHTGDGPAWANPRLRRYRLGERGPDAVARRQRWGRGAFRLCARLPGGHCKRRQPRSPSLRRGARRSTPCAGSPR